MCVINRFSFTIYLHQGLVPKPQARVAVLMGSPSDMDHSEKIGTTLKSFGIPCELRVTSAHKGTDETKRILADYEGKIWTTFFESMWSRGGGVNWNPKLVKTGI